MTSKRSDPGWEFANNVYRTDRAGGMNDFFEITKTTGLSITRPPVVVSLDELGRQFDAELTSLHTASSGLSSSAAFFWRPRNSPGTVSGSPGWSSVIYLSAQPDGGCRSRVTPKLHARLKRPFWPISLRRMSGAFLRLAARCLS